MISLLAVTKEAAECACQHLTHFGLTPSIHLAQESVNVYPLDNRSFVPWGFNIDQSYRIVLHRDAWLVSLDERALLGNGKEAASSLIEQTIKYVKQQGVSRAYMTPYTEEHAGAAAKLLVASQVNYAICSNNYTALVFADYEVTAWLHGQMANVIRGTSEAGS